MMTRSVKEHLVGSIARRLVQSARVSLVSFGHGATRGTTVPWCRQLVFFGFWFLLVRVHLLWSMNASDLMCNKTLFGDGTRENLERGCSHLCGAASARFH